MAGEDVKIGALKRRRALVEALTQQGMQGSQGQMVGQVYVAPSWLEAFSRPLSVLASAYAGERMDKEEASLQQQRSQGLAEALQRLQGREGMDFTQGALTSEYPELQQMGMQKFAASLSPRNQEKFGKQLQTVQGPSGELVNVLVGDRGNIQEVGGYKPYEKPSFGNIKTIQNPDGTLGYIAMDREGNIKPLEGVEAYARPPAQTNINMPKQESAFGKVMGEKDAARYDNANTILQNEASQQDMISRVKALEELPVLRGGLAPLAVKAVQIGSTLGVPVPENVANAEQLDAIIEGAVVQFIQQGGRGITDEEGKRMVKTWPGLLQTAEGAKKVRQQMEEISARNTKQARTTQRVLQQRYPDAFPSQAPASSGGNGIKFLGFE